MIIHSIIDPEIVFKGMDDDYDNMVETIDWNGLKLEIKSVEKGVYEVNRIISTNLSDFLNQELQPGVRFSASYKPGER